MHICQVLQCTVCEVLDSFGYHIVRLYLPDHGGHVPSIQLKRCISGGSQHAGVDGKLSQIDPVNPVLLVRSHHHVEYLTHVVVRVFGLAICLGMVQGSH